MLRVGGPYNAKVSTESPTRDKLYVCNPAGANDEACAKQIISNLARRAYRRSITDSELAGLMEKLCLAAHHVAIAADSLLIND